MVGAIVLSSTDAPSQEPVVGSAQRVVVVRARTPRDAAVQHRLEYLGSRGALGRSYSSRVYFRKLHRGLRKRRSTSMDRSAFWLTFSPRYTNSFVWLYTWPAAYTLNVAVDSGIPLARKHMTSVLASDTVRPNAAHTTTITTIFLNCSGDCETTRTAVHHQSHQHKIKDNQPTNQQPLEPLF